MVNRLGPALQTRIHDALSAVALAMFVLGITGCTPEARGFKLPPGNAEAGMQTFQELGCNQCHSVGSIARNAESTSELDVQLGGPVGRVKTYGDLLTSIIHPSHRILKTYPPQDVATEAGTSRMRDYSETMTVKQLVNLVTFLESEYELQPTPSFF